MSVVRRSLLQAAPRAASPEPVARRTAPPSEPGPDVLRPGDPIGVWVVQKNLGRGGMGTVYRCENRHANRVVVAIKLLDRALLHHRTARARFVREAEILSTLDHPNIVKVTNVHLDAMPPYLEMEFVEGSSLEQELATTGAVTVPRALGLVEQLADAVRYLHGRGVYHRDIKPANMVLRSDGRLKLVDFGLAVEADQERVTAMGETFGTASYTPPEWCGPDPVDPRAWDLYAIGVVLYELLTAEVAFPAPAGLDGRWAAIQVMSAKQRLACLDPGASFAADLRSLVRDLTHRDPRRRPKSADELLGRLEQLDRRPAGETTDFDSFEAILTQLEASTAPAASPRTVVAPPAVATPPSPSRHPAWGPALLAVLVSGVGATGAVGLLLVWMVSHLLGGRPAPPGAAPSPDLPVAAVVATAAPEPAPEPEPDPEPEPAPIEAPPVAAPAPVAPPAADPPRRRAASHGPVAAAAFGAWLASNPQWHREPALAAGLADDGYLRGWTDTDPPPGVDVATSVSWAAAAAYCATRGGLAGVDDAPLSWDEAPGRPLQEWRDAGGRPSWRRYDGVSSTVATGAQANSFTGFRCRK